MNRTQLLEELRRVGVAPEAYSLDGVDLPERYTLRAQHSQWAVYYHERGMRNLERLFDSESEAMGYFLELILQDSTTRYPRTSA